MPMLRANYKRIAYRDNPPTNGASQPRETFVLVHGLGSSQNYWAAVVPKLTAQGYRCVSLDTSGAGRSPYTWIEQTPASLAADIKDAMDALKIDKAVVCGHSMGGFTVPQMAVDYPDRVSAIVLVGAVYPKKELVPVFEDRIQKVEANGMDAMADAIPWAAVGSKANDSHRAMIREILSGQDPNGYISLCRVIARAWQFPVKYGQIKCPALMIAGEEDKSGPPADSERIKNEVGSQEKKMVVQKGVGHWNCVEVPDEVAEEIIGFFKQIQHGGSSRL